VDEEVMVDAVDAVNIAIMVDVTVVAADTEDTAVAVIMVVMVVITVPETSPVARARARATKLQALRRPVQAWNTRKVDGLVENPEVDPVERAEKVVKAVNKAGVNNAARPKNKRNVSRPK
jgi:hypothetical protein